MALVGLLLLGELVHGFRIFGTPWLGGDLLYHQALAHEILRGELIPGGPYAGLPTYYPPGFHFLLAGVMGTLGLDAVRADQLLALVWMPVLPIGTFLLARRITGRPWVAVLAATLTMFAGALDLRAGRLWVNSLFLSGQQAYPLYPRDLVFGILPFAVLAFLHAIRQDITPAGVFRWAARAGLLFGLAGLIQIQLLLPLPFALGATAVVVAERDPTRRRWVVFALLVTGIVAAIVVAPWLFSQLESIRRNGGVALDSSDTLEPARFGFWNYPREFGLLLPLGLIGAGMAVLFLKEPADSFLRRRTDRWRPSPVEGGILLVAWWAFAFVLGIFYQPTWPLEDALRPQRLWLLASQPLAILAAIGLVAGAEVVVARRWRRPELVAPLIAAVVVASALPSSVATASLLRSTWMRPSYAELDLAADHVPDFPALLGDRGAPPQTVLTYEDWSALTWFLTGDKVVALVPPGFGKLAYDPATFTGHSQAQRRADLASAFAGDPARLAAVADAYGARKAIVALRDGRWGLFDISAALRPLPGRARVFQGNGWDGVELPAGAQLSLTTNASGPMEVEIRLAVTLATPADTARTISLSAVGPKGSLRELAKVLAPATNGSWQVLHASVPASPGDALVLTSSELVTVQSIRGFMALGAAPPGWRIVSSTADEAMLERTP
jgi:hypothetical protein